MNTIPPSLLEDLYTLSQPRQRAARLNDLADAHELTGFPHKARLLSLIADTESLLDNPDHDLSDDNAWDMDAWWQLGGTTDRNERAALLHTIWEEWGRAEAGDDADVLLQIADTERTVGLDSLISEVHAKRAVDLDADLDHDAVATSAYEPVSATPSRVEKPRSRAAAILLWTATVAIALCAVLAAVISVAAPATPLPFRLASALLLISAVFAVLWWRSGR